MLGKCLLILKGALFHRVAKIWNQLPSNTDFTSLMRALTGFNLTTYCDCWHFAIWFFKRVYNITVFISYLTCSDYIFHGAALVALPCSCRRAALFHCLIAVSYLLFYLLCLLIYNKWNEIIITVLSSFKSGYVTPLPKKADLDAADVKSYRPITNLSVVSKLLERGVGRQHSTAADHISDG